MNKQTYGMGAKRPIIRSVTLTLPLFTALFLMGVALGGIFVYGAAL